MRFGILAGAALLAVGGCATVVDGTHQTIQLSSNASNATCSISQNGEVIVPSSPLPATHTLARIDGNLIVSCQAEGYEPSTLALMAGKNPLSIVGNVPMIAGGAWIDTLLGGSAEYQDRAYIYLLRAPVS